MILDVFNVFNGHETLEVDPDYVYEGLDTFNQWTVASNLDSFGNPRFNANLPRSPFYSTPTLFQSPRTVQVGFKFTF